jgi:hypothetical protein
MTLYLARWKCVNGCGWDKAALASLARPRAVSFQKASHINVCIVGQRMECVNKMIRNAW